MWFKMAQEKTRQIAYPPRSQWISKVEFLGDGANEDEELFPEYVDGDLSLEVYDERGQKKVYTYPSRDLQEFNDIAFSGGYGFWDHGLDDAPFI